MPAINENGVYVGDDIPTCRFEKNRYLFCIYLLQVEGGFIVGSEARLPNMGHGFGLTTNSQAHPSKLEAIKHALAYFKRAYGTNISDAMLEEFKQRLAKTFDINFDNQMTLF